MTSIGSWAFRNCSKLSLVKIPNSVTSIGSYAFDKTKWYENQPDGLVYAGLVLYIYKGTMPANTNVEIKEGTKGIAEEAFMNCSGLTSITIPNSVTNIGAQAFRNCYSLTSINIPETVTSIENYTFYNCSGLTSITIPNSVTSIGKNAFGNCGRIRSITCEANTPPSCISSIDSYDKNIPVYVPANSVDAYKEADVWKDFTNIQAITNTGVKEIQAANNKYVIYDMNGRMVNEKNLKPGMYVKNGKKLVIK